MRISKVTSILGCWRKGKGTSNNLHLWRIYSTLYPPQEERLRFEQIQCFGCQKLHWARDSIDKIYVSSEIAHWQYTPRWAGNWKVWERCNVWWLSDKPLENVSVLSPQTNSPTSLTTALAVLPSFDSRWFRQCPACPVCDSASLHSDWAQKRFDGAMRTN